MRFSKSSAVACSKLFLGWLLVSAAFASSVPACSAEPGTEQAAKGDAGKKRSSSNSSDDDDPPSKKKKTTDADDDADDDASAAGDAGSDAPSADAQPKDSSAPVCSTPLAFGDLEIVELMIAARGGQADDGEWIEIRNARSCTANLKGLSISSPRGSGPENTVTITTDVLVPPGGRFIVADSAVPSVNGNLPGTVIALPGTPSDVLANDGDEIYVELGATLIEAFEYTINGITPGQSVMFPETCPASVRHDASRWRGSVHSWTAGKFGTPNAPNNDLACN